MIYEQGSKSISAPHYPRSNTLISWLKAKRVIFQLSALVSPLHYHMPPEGYLLMW
jgi:hypothetical protein